MNNSHSVNHRQMKVKLVHKWNGEIDSLNPGDVLFNGPSGCLTDHLCTNVAQSTPGIYTYDLTNKYWLKLERDNVLYWTKSLDGPQIGAEVSNIDCIWFSNERWSIQENDDVELQFWMGLPECPLLLECTVIRDTKSFSRGVQFIHKAFTQGQSRDNPIKMNDLSGWNIIENPHDLILDIYHSSQPLKGVGVLNEPGNTEWEVVPEEEEEEEEEKEEEWTEDPNYDDWCEKREDPFDYNWYTQKEFMNYYGSLIQWSMVDPRKVIKRKMIGDIVALNGKYLHHMNVNHLLDKYMDTFC